MTNTSNCNRCNIEPNWPHWHPRRGLTCSASLLPSDRRMALPTLPLVAAVFPLMLLLISTSAGVGLVALFGQTVSALYPPAKNKIKKFLNPSGGFESLKRHKFRKATVKAGRQQSDCRRSGGKLRIRQRTHGFNVLALTLCLSASAAFGGDRVYKIDLPAQSVADALTRLSEQADVQVLFPYDIAKAKRGNAVVGEFTLQRTLDLLLRDTGLTGGLSDKGVLMISLQKSARSDSERREAMNNKKSLLAAVVGLLFGSGEAQQALGQELSEKELAFVLEEIIVTATKRSESVQDVPISITALGENQIKQTGAQSLQDIAASIPNMVWPEGRTQGESGLSLRGTYSQITAETIGFDTGVSIYLDNVLLGKQGIFNTDLGEIERVEVLRGPQGTLFGKNAIGGAINIISKKPGDEFEGKIELDTGNFNLIRARGSVNVPLVQDVLSARLSVNKARRDGYITNLFDGDDNYGNIDKESGRLQVAYTPTDATVAHLGVDWGRSETQFILGEYTAESIYDDGKAYTVNFDFPSYTELDNLGVSVTVEHDFTTGHTLTAIAGWRDDEIHEVVDVDNRPFDGFNRNEIYNHKQITQELRISSPTGGAFDYVAGIYYFNQENTSDAHDFYGEDWLGQFGPSWVGEGFFHWQIDAESYAAFIHSNIYLNEKLTLFGGVRYTYEKKEGTFLNENCVPAQLCVNFGLMPIGVVSPYPVDLEMEEPSWSAGLRYALREEVMIYGSVSTGVKSGAFNTSGNPVADLQAQNLLADPEFVTSYEIGAKSSWLNGRLKANMALFYMDYTDLQVRAWCPTCGAIVQGVPQGALILSNAASVTSQGVELELSALLNEQWSLNAGIGYLDSTFDKFEGVADERPVALGGLGIADASGKHVALSPEWTINFSAQYEKSLAFGGSWISRMDYRYVADRWSAVGVLNTDDTFLPEHHLLNARTGYRSADERWDVFLWAKNLTDEREPIYGRFNNFIRTSGLRQKYMEPRTYGINANYNF